MKRYYLIIISLFVSFIFSSYSSKHLFLANSPKVNPFYLTNLKNDFIKARMSLAALFVNPFKSNNPIVNTAEIPVNLLKPVTSGVSAYEGGDGQSYLKIDKGTTYKIRQIQLGDGTVVNAIDFTGE